MKNKRTLVLGIALFLFAIVAGGVFAQNVVLRSTQYFAGDGITLRLNSNGSMVLSVINDLRSGEWAVSSGTYTISGDTIVLISDSGNVLARAPFQWEQRGSTIRWIEISGTRLNRR